MNLHLIPIGFLAGYFPVQSTSQAGTWEGEGLRYRKGFRMSEGSTDTGVSWWASGGASSSGCAAPRVHKMVMSRNYRRDRWNER
jgi:hypothetical protein